MPLTVHGHAKSKLHSATSTYRSWLSMIQRCLNPNNPRFSSYGGRGICICQKWIGNCRGEGFSAFLFDLGPRPEGKSLDRFPDYDGNYEPGNCRWATPEQQQNNQATTIVLSFEGRTQSLSDWAKEVGIKKATLYGRLRNSNWNVPLSLSSPLNEQMSKMRRRRVAR